MIKLIKTLLKYSKELSPVLLGAAIVTILFYVKTIDSYEKKENNLILEKSKLLEEKEYLLKNKLIFENKKLKFELEKQKILKEKENLAAEVKTLNLKNKTINQLTSKVAISKKIHTLINSIKNYNPDNEKEARAIQISISEIKDLTKKNNIEKFYSESLLELSSYAESIHLSRLEKQREKESSDFFNTVSFSKSSK